MSELAYLGMALLVSVAGSIVFLRHQRRPQSLESGVQQFSRGISALASIDETNGRRRTAAMKISARRGPASGE